MNLGRNREIYFDYAANTPIDKRVAKTMLPYYSESFGNPSSLHVRGRRSGKVLDTTRSSIATHIGAAPDEIIFTGSGTEANNLAILGVARAYRQIGNHIIVSQIEHKSILEPCRILEQEGFKVTYVPVSKEGVVDIEYLLNQITPQTILISIMMVNNEIGSMQPIQEMVKRIQQIKNKGVPFVHTDACQAITLLPVNVSELPVDLLTLNSSKVYGPNGIGLLYKKKEVKVDPLIVGGGQEHGTRAGTENISLIVGFAKALELAISMRTKEYSRLKELQTYLQYELARRIPNILFNSNPEYAVPSITHITLPFIEGESMMMMLDEHSICVSTGSACSAHDLRPSHVLTAIGQSPELIHGSLRISLGRFTTKSEIDSFLATFPKIVETLTKLSPLHTL